VGSAFIVGVLTIAVDKGATVVFLGVPLGLALLVTYQLQVYADAKVLRLYQGDIEALINQCLGRELLNSAVATRARGSAFNPTVRIVRWIYAIVVVAAAIWGLVVCGREFYDDGFSGGNPFPLILYLTSAGLAFYIMWLASRELGDVWTRNAVLQARAAGPVAKSFWTNLGWRGFLFAGISAVAALVSLITVR
jgi:hypothetical protein